MKNQHTPTPWATDGKTILSYGRQIAHIFNDHQYQNNKYGSSKSGSEKADIEILESKANAHHIVKCVNERDALVEACKHALALLASYAPKETATLNELHKVLLAESED